MYWLVDGVRFDDDDRAAAKIVTEDDIPQGDFDIALDEEEGSVRVCGLTYAVSDVLKNVDPTAYRCMFLDWVDNMLSENRADVKKMLWRMYSGDEEEINGHMVVCVDEEEEDEDDGE